MVTAAFIFIWFPTLKHRCSNNKQIIQKVKSPRKMMRMMKRREVIHQQLLLQLITWEAWDEVCQCLVNLRNQCLRREKMPRPEHLKRRWLLLKLLQPRLVTLAAIW